MVFADDNNSPTDIPPPPPPPGVSKTTLSAVKLGAVGVLTEVALLSRKTKKSFSSSAKAMYDSYVSDDAPGKKEKLDTKLARAAAAGLFDDPKDGDDQDQPDDKKPAKKVNRRPPMMVDGINAKPFVPPGTKVYRRHSHSDPNNRPMTTIEKTVGAMAVHSVMDSMDPQTTDDPESIIARAAVKSTMKNSFSSLLSDPKANSNQPLDVIGKAAEEEVKERGYAIKDDVDMSPNLGKDLKSRFGF